MESGPNRVLLSGISQLGLLVHRRSCHLSFSPVLRFCSRFHCRCLLHARQAATHVATGLSFRFIPRYSFFMPRQQPHALASSPWRLLLGILCVGLVLLAGTLSVTHTHQRSLATHAECGLCAAGHSIVPNTAVVPELSIAQVFYTPAEVAPPIAPARTLSHAALFIRPPPDCALFA